VGEQENPENFSGIVGLGAKNKTVRGKLHGVLALKPKEKLAKQPTGWEGEGYHKKEAGSKIAFLTQRGGHVGEGNLGKLLGNVSLC